MNRKNVVIFTLIIFAIIIAIVLLTNKLNSEQTELESHPSIENQPTIGDADAVVSIVEFGDYKCPSCKAWGEDIYPKLKEKYIDTGKAKFSFINVLFHGNESKLASLASESVYKQDPASFWDFHEAIFAAQPEAQQHDQQWVTTDKLLEIAKSSAPNVDLNQLEEDINHDGTLEQVLIDDSLVKEFDIPFTPTIVINGVMLKDPFDYKAIESIIEEELK
ncbi:DsbA family protein [Lederbergia graminis]|uniref:DsbA family protein n=1 Tax=Lederbergia graminis TaxID=735518 RepID=A0ABW0LH19_9BACI